jgi:hypothetical protein
VHEHAEFAARGTPTLSGRAILQTCGALRYNVEEMRRNQDQPEGSPYRLELVIRQMSRTIAGPAQGRVTRTWIYGHFHVMSRPMRAVRAASGLALGAQSAVGERSSGRGQSAASSRRGPATRHDRIRRVPRPASRPGERARSQPKPCPHPIAECAGSRETAQRGGSRARARVRRWVVVRHGVWAYAMDAWTWSWQRLNG